MDSPYAPAELEDDELELEDDELLDIPNM